MMSGLLNESTSFFRLTAFVLRSFGKAQSFIYVDPATMEQSKTWLERQQGQRGCFRTLGKLLNNRIKVFILLINWLSVSSDWP
jgi:hypothetical protein